MGRAEYRAKTLAALEKQKIKRSQRSAQALQQTDYAAVFDHFGL